MSSNISEKAKNTDGRTLADVQASFNTLFVEKMRLKKLQRRATNGSVAARMVDALREFYKSYSEENRAKGVDDFRTTWAVAQNLQDNGGKLDPMLMMLMNGGGKINPAMLMMMTSMMNAKQRGDVNKNPMMLAMEQLAKTGKIDPMMMMGGGSTIFANPGNAKIDEKKPVNFLTLVKTVNNGNTLYFSELIEEGIIDFKEVVEFLTTPESQFAEWSQLIYGSKSLDAIEKVLKLRHDAFAEKERDRLQRVWLRQFDKELRCSKLKSHQDIEIRLQEIEKIIAVEHAILKDFESKKV